MQSAQHQLLGAQVSYYTAKVRAYLRWKQIPFSEVAATREIYRDVIVPRTGVRFIPVLITDDDIAVQDSSAIIDLLEQRYTAHTVLPEAPTQRLVALLFEAYADEWLLLPAMHYRWNLPENREFAMLEFGRLSIPEASPAEQRALGEKLAGPFAGALPALGIHATTAPAIEASYHELLADLSQHFAHYPYLLGTRPCLGDLALFGPLYAHLYRDPASGRLMQRIAPRVADWVERLRSDRSTPGSFLPDDEVPPTLEPLLARVFREFGPVLSGTLARLATFTPSATAEYLPRAIGRHEFRLGGATAERAIYPFNAYRWQRCSDYYAQLQNASRAHADRLLDKTGGLALLSTAVPRRLERIHNQLRFVR